MAHLERFELPAHRLTADCSTTELKVNNLINEKNLAMNSLSVVLVTFQASPGTHMGCRASSLTQRQDVTSLDNPFRFQLSFSPFSKGSHL